MSERVDFLWKPEGPGRSSAPLRVSEAGVPPAPLTPVQAALGSPSPHRSQRLAGMAGGSFSARQALYVLSHLFPIHTHGKQVSEALESQSLLLETQLFSRKIGRGT